MTSAAGFALNGRFLGQPVTGVQRYARNVASSIAERLLENGRTAPIMTPEGTEDPGFAAMPIRRCGPWTSHAWEQATLPLRWRGPLLNLCNTAPLAGRQQVVCIHDANLYVSPDSYGRSFRAAYKIVQPLLARGSACITTVSAFSADEIARHLPLTRAAIEVLPNGHEHALAWRPDLAVEAPLVIENRPRGAEAPFVLAIGSRARHKNLGLLVTIAPALADMGLDIVIAGGSHAIFGSDRTPEAPNLHSIGYVSDHDLAYLMDRALCLVFPSWTEGFGLPIVEAMARRCPVVSSDRASMPEVCGNAALLAPPDDPDAWLRQIRRLHDSAGLRAELNGRAGEQVAKFSWRATAAAYVDLIADPVRASRIDAPRAPADPPSVAVVIATTRRPEIVERTVGHLMATQTLKPIDICVSCVRAEDAGALGELEGVRVVTGPQGLASQRNTGLHATTRQADIVVFFDDDFVAADDWLAEVAHAFARWPDVVGLTGHVVADGIKGPGLTFEEGVRLLATPGVAPDRAVVEPYSLYGCNMAFRREAIGSTRFDPRLVLYGWLEDRDFTAALSGKGRRMIKYAGAQGVHLGVKSGRVSGERLGYSQMVNPVYLLRKGTMTKVQVLDHMFRNLASNLARAAKPEPFIDRRGRLRGNLIGLGDILRGRIEPERAAQLRTFGGGVTR